MSLAAGFGVVLRDLPSAPHEGDLLAAIMSTKQWNASSLQVPLAALPGTSETQSVRAIRSALSDNNVQLSVSLGVLNAVFPERNPALNVDLASGLARAFGRMTALDIPVAHVTIGTLEDRFGESGGPAWPTQLRENREMLARAAELAASVGVTLVLKTHEEMSTYEVADLVGAIDSPALRVGFSAVNVLTRLEDPAAAFERVWGLTHTVFIDDAVLERNPQGFRRHLVEVGTGMVDWAAIRESAAAAPQPISFVIDLHRAEFEMPFYTPGWLAREPHVTVTELASLFEASRSTAPVLPSPDTRFAAAREFVLA